MTAWEELLSRSILDDRVDRGASLEDSVRRTQEYARWLERIPRNHDPSACPGEVQLRRWPGDIGFHTGQATILVGAQGKGKTNAIAYMIEHALVHRPDWDVYTNIPFPWELPENASIPHPANLHPIGSMSQMLRGISNSILANRIPVIAIDEMDQVDSSHEWSNAPSESWTKFLYVERHFRVRGPLLAYHVYEHVPLALRRVGDLRGSYFRVVNHGGQRLLARVEDPSRWFGVRESVLPYLTLGLRGFAIDIDMAQLEPRLDGDRYKFARQTIAYLDEVAAKAEAAGQAKSTSARRNEAFEERNQEIVRILIREPKTTNRMLRDFFLTNIEGGLLARLRAEADRARRSGVSGQ